MRIRIALIFAMMVAFFSISAVTMPLKHEPLGCGQNVHSYAIAREC